MSVDREGLEGSAQALLAWLAAFAEADLDDVVADSGITAGMVYQQEALTVQLARVRRLAAALGAPPVVTSYSAPEENDVNHIHGGRHIPSSDPLVEAVKAPIAFVPYFQVVGEAKHVTAAQSTWTDVWERFGGGGS